MFTKLLTFTVLATLALVPAGEGPTAAPTCCMKNAYCCRINEACCPKGAATATTTANANAAPTCCMKNAYCCRIREACCPKRNLAL